MSSRIGGHAGLDVVREQAGVWKIAHAREGAEACADARDEIAREVAALAIMSGSGYTPEVLDVAADRVLLSDVGTCEPVTDDTAYLHHTIRALSAVRARGLRHGDGTAANVVVRGNRPMLTDWGDAHPLDTAPPREKQPWSDSHLLLRTYAQHSGDGSRVAARWLAILADLGADDAVLGLPLAGRTLVDFGCHDGRFVRLAAAEGMRAVGLDRIPVTPEVEAPESVADWRIWRTDVVEWRGAPYSDAEPDVALCLSVWPYIAHHHGRTAAERFLARVAAQARTFYFETQLAGDGPGLEAHRTDDDVWAWLRTVTGREADLLVSAPVAGREATRTVWALRREDT